MVDPMNAINGSPAEAETLEPAQEPGEETAPVAAEDAAEEPAQ
ncbi:MAG TPA: hypothetical protein VM013_06090 [Dehalococcoidia bacterium]|nr:hypothetical protein [Dehalococcoidia bacterium]